MESTFIISRDKDADVLKKTQDTSLCFYDLVKLRHKLSAQENYETLSLHNKIVLKLCRRVLDGETEGEEWVASPFDYVEAVHGALKWVVKSIAASYREGDDYETVLDGAASLLIRVYSNKTVLPDLVDIVFSRNRNGRFCNDLIFTVFESRCIDVLQCMAKYLDSRNAKDVELARRLLGFIWSDLEDVGDKRCSSDACVHWIEENRMFLNYTGESFQECIRPKPYRISLKAKYLVKAISLDTGNFVQPLSEGELTALQCFGQLDRKTRRVVANYSYSLYKQNEREWKAWIHYPIAMQVYSAYGEWLKHD